MSERKGKSSALLGLSQCDMTQWPPTPHPPIQAITPPIKGYRRNYCVNCPEVNKAASWNLKFKCSIYLHSALVLPVVFWARCCPPGVRKRKETAPAEPPNWIRVTESADGCYVTTFSKRTDTLDLWSRGRTSPKASAFHQAFTKYKCQKSGRLEVFNRW